MPDLLNEEVRVVNVGVAGFADAVRVAGGVAIDLDWKPPGEGDAQSARRLAAVVNRAEIEAANRAAYALYLGARPVLTGLARAGDVLPDLGERMLLHAGPPVAWEAMCGPMRGALVGAMLLEGWAKDPEGATAIAASGEVIFDSCHHHQAVGPMAGVISPSMPVWVVENREHGNRAFCTLNEGLGQVLRFGAHGPVVIERLRWLGTILGPALATTLDATGGIELKPLIAQALHMGDEVHNRNAAASSLLFKRLVAALIKCDLAQAEVAAVVDFMAGNDHFFLNLSMAACKAMLDAAHGVAASSMVTAMARNGVEFGIRVSGLDGWFTADAPVIDGLYFPNYGPIDAARDLGDSAITETAGLGGFAMAAAPAIVQFVGGGPDTAVASTAAMAHITLGRNSAFTLPAMNFAGTPAGIDVRKVVDTGICPVINTGIAHKDAGIGQIGAGITRAPMACFVRAVTALADLTDE